LITAYGYVRTVATSKSKRHNELRKQTAAIRHYRERVFGKSPRIAIGEIFSDSGICEAGRVFRSLPAAKLLLARIRHGDHIVVGDLGLAFATYTDFLRNLQFWRIQNITVHIAQKGLRLSINSPVGVTAVAVLRCFAEGNRQHRRARQLALEAKPAQSRVE